MFSKGVMALGCISKDFLEDCFVRQFLISVIPYLRKMNGGKTDFGSLFQRHRPLSLGFLASGLIPGEAAADHHAGSR